MFGNCQEQSFLGWSIPIAVAGVGPRSNGITKFAERRKRVITLARSSVISTSLNNIRSNGDSHRARFLQCVGSHDTINRISITPKTPQNGTKARCLALAPSIRLAGHDIAQVTIGLEPSRGRV